MAGSALQASNVPTKRRGQSWSPQPAESPTGVSGRPFLTAIWRHLAMLNYRADPQWLLPLVPQGTHLDLYEGEAIVTLVGFMFERARLFGIPIPWHQQFAEVNLRFYVRRLVNGQQRRGVVFIKEIVPRRLVAWTARYLYGEQFARVPVTCRSDEPPSCARESTKQIVYAWGRSSAAGQMSLTVDPNSSAMLPHGEAAFVIDRSWAYTVGRGGRWREYYVRHLPWRFWPAHTAQLVGNHSIWYGPALGDSLQHPTLSAFLADGSEVEVLRVDPQCPER